MGCRGWWHGSTVTKMMKSWTWLIAEVQAERAAMSKVAPVRGSGTAGIPPPGHASDLLQGVEIIGSTVVLAFSSLMCSKNGGSLRASGGENCAPPVRVFNRHLAINKSRTINSGCGGRRFLLAGLKGLRGWKSGGNRRLLTPPRSQKSPAIDSNCRRPVRCPYFAIATVACAVA